MKSPDYESQRPTEKIGISKLQDRVRTVIDHGYRYHLLEAEIAFYPDYLFCIVLPEAFFPVSLCIVTTPDLKCLDITPVEPQDCNFSFSSREPQYGKPQEKVVAVYFRRPTEFSNLLIRAENNLDKINIKTIPELGFYAFSEIGIYGQYEGKLKSPSRILPPLVFLDEEENKVCLPREKVKPSEIFVFAGFYGRTQKGILTSGFVVGKKLRE